MTTVICAMTKAEATILVSQAHLASAMAILVPKPAGDILVKLAEDLIKYVEQDYGKV